MCKISDTANIVLIGFMGAGKSSVGSELAHITGKRLVDLDELIVRRQVRTIAEIFAEEGETAFRDYETAALESLTGADLVVATGGGIVGRPENWTLMRRMGTVVYLRADWLTLRTRITGCTKRPLATADRSEEEIVALFERRLPLYEQADLVFDTDGKTIFETAGEIWREIKDRCRV